MSTGPKKKSMKVMRGGEGGGGGGGGLIKKRGRVILEEGGCLQQETMLDLSSDAVALDITVAEDRLEQMQTTKCWPYNRLE